MTIRTAYRDQSRLCNSNLKERNQWSDWSTR